ncbi:ABC transporter substrate-binding protein [Bradyrhizobium sp.]|uniref:ABC transporter substrate-binding protein n=1 Tax=Bradyrhizobium sp. TaxID=376 RepID=UPI0023A40B55|nr:ABC transporter substrate-binding protein [Bradyrhizobium sp.]MDE2376785.1 ABC transporter substrate-binding protein [Bradyrhizobium sp.]
MRRREFISALGGVAAWPLAARAQRLTKVPRIGVLWQGASAETHPYYRPLRDGFKAAGYAEGSLIFEDRFFDKNSENVDVLAKQLVDLNCDVLMGITIPPAFALRRATSTIPIVFVFNPNPVGSGLVSSLNHPGGNVTGIAHVTAYLAAKRVELLRDTIPGLASVAMIYDPSPGFQFATRPELEDTRTAANQLGLSFESFECGGPEALEEAFSRASRSGAVILGASVWHVFNLKRIAELAIERKLAVISQADDYPEAGLLMSYGANWKTVAREAASLVKKILEGERPENIPVQEPTTFDLVFNLKTAQALGLQVPPIMLARATRVID